MYLSSVIPSLSGLSNTLAAFESNHAIQTSGLWLRDQPAPAALPVKPSMGPNGVLIKPNGAEPTGAEPPMKPSMGPNGVLVAPKLTNKPTGPVLVPVPTTPAKPGAKDTKKLNGWEGLIPGKMNENIHINPGDLKTLVPLPVKSPLKKPPTKATPLKQPLQPAQPTKPIDWAAALEQLAASLSPADFKSLSQMLSGPTKLPQPQPQPQSQPQKTQQPVAPLPAKPTSLSKPPTQPTELPEMSGPFEPLQGPSIDGAVSPKLLYNFGNGTWVENIAVGPGSTLFLTLYDRPELYRFDPWGPNKKPVLVRRFADEGRLSGIAEIAPNEYAILVSRRFMPLGKGTTEIWVVRCDDECDGTLQYSRKTGKLNVEWIGGPYPDLEPLNGLTAAGPNLVLASDTLNGKIYAFNVPGMTATIVLNDSRMLSPGVTGLRLVGQNLYFSNMVNGIFGRIQVDVTKVLGAMYAAGPHAAAGVALHNIATSPVHIIARNLVGVNDFAVSPKGDAAYIADYGGSALLKVNLKDGTVSKFAHIPGGPTSAQFGRRPEDRDIIYVVTSSGALFSVKA